MRQVPARKRSFDRWSPEETDVLIKAWAPLYSRRLSGTKDAWVPLHIRGRARTSRALVTEDWRAVAFAVNSYRAVTARLGSSRTHLQCKKRMEHLKRQYVKGLAPRLGWPFFGVLHAVWADEVGDRGGAGAVEPTRGAPAGYDGAAADEGGCPSGDERGIAMVDGARATAAAEGLVPAGDPTHGSAVEAPGAAVVIEGAAAAAGDAGGTASLDARGGAFVHEDCRAAPVVVSSCRTSDGISSESRTHKQCRVRVKRLSYLYEKKHDVGCGAAVGEQRGGASVDGRGAAAEAAATRRATFAPPPPVPKRPRRTKPAASFANMAVDDGVARVSEAAEATVADLSAQAMAAGSVDAAVVTKLAEIYKELRMKVLDVEREKAAAAHAGAGGRA